MMSISVSTSCRHFRIGLIQLADTRVRDLRLWPDVHLKAGYHFTESKINENQPFAP